MSETSEIFKTMDLALRIGELLLSSGAGAADVSAQMSNVGVACGLRGLSADVTFTELAMSYQARPDEPAVIQLRQVRQRQTDFGHLTRVDHLVRALVAGRIERDEAAAELNRIVSSGHGRPRWSVTLGWGVMGAGFALVLAGDWLVVLLAFVAACVIDEIQYYMTRQRWPLFYQQVAGGLFATLLAAAIHANGVDLSPSGVISASIILMLAGVSFLGAIQDALTGFPLTSGARILEAIIATGGIIAGVSGGITLARLLGIGLGSLDPGPIKFANPLVSGLGAGLAAVAYAFASYTPYRGLIPIGLIAGSAAALYVFAFQHSVGIAWASAVAALLIGLVSYGVAGRIRIPALVVVTAAIIPLLPGLSIYRGLALFNEGGTRGLGSIFTAAAIAVAVSAGVIFGQYVAQPIRREARRMESKLAGPRLVGPLNVRSVRRRRKPKA